MHRNNRVNQIIVIELNHYPVYTPIQKKCHQFVSPGLYISQVNDWDINLKSIQYSDWSLLSSPNRYERIVLQHKMIVQFLISAIN